jgi:hypothetical protein
MSSSLSSSSKTRDGSAREESVSKTRDESARDESGSRARESEGRESSVEVVKVRDVKGRNKGKGIRVVSNEEVEVEEEDGGGGHDGEEGGVRGDGVRGFGGMRMRRNGMEK